ncbi:MAG: OmpA family protein [Chitinispirillaceae bacterium]
MRHLVFVGIMVCVCGIVTAEPVQSDTGKIEEVTPTVPAVSYWGTRGLPQTTSAEPLGFGRLGFSVSGTYYRQNQKAVSLPIPETNVGTARLGFSFGLNNQIDAFGSFSIYGTILNGNTKSSGVGNAMAGLQGSLPLPEQMPFKLGAQLFYTGGPGKSSINDYRTDGYNYFEVNTNNNAVVKLCQSLIFGKEGHSLKLHFNEGYAKALGTSQSGLLLLSAGIQGEPADYLSLGLEVNSRTLVNDITISDPLWITPSVAYRTPYYMGFMLGADISLSSERNLKPSKPLESFRIFSEVTFSIDVMAKQRKELAEKRRREEEEKAELQKKAQQFESMADSLARKAKEDSIKTLQTAQKLAQKAKQDSLRAIAVADSLDRVAQTLAQKAKQDSIALLETRKKLENEKSKRTEAEKKLLSTGLLILDAVYFQSGKAEISLNSRPYLKIIAKMLLKYPKLKLEVGGHTDNLGRLELNVALSKRRAESVQSYLEHVEPKLNKRLSARGYGPSLPKADNSTPKGRQINRRVELKVLNPEVLKEYSP